MIALPRIHDMILDMVKHRIENLRLGSVLLEISNPPDMGAMISSRSFSRLESLIDSAVKAGAILHCGGHRFNHPSYPSGVYFEPTLISNVDPTMAIAQTELFAPVFLLMRAQNVDEAISLANSTSYGLGASVFGHNQADLLKCKRGIKSGMVSTNDFGSYYAVSLPFGGTKGSGYGRFGGEEGLRALCNVKALCDDAPWARMLGIRTQIPPPLQYPVKGRIGWEACKGIIFTGYSLSIRQQIGGVVSLVTALMSKDEDSKSKND